MERVAITQEKPVPTGVNEDNGGEEHNIASVPRLSFYKLNVETSTTNVDTF